MKIFSKGKSGGSDDVVTKPARPAPPAQLAPRKVERRAPARPEERPSVRPERDVASSEACALIDWFSAGSVREIDGLIIALQTLCEDLYVERRRVQRELSDFARVSNAALETTTIIVQTLGQWRPPERGG